MKEPDRAADLRGQLAGWREAVGAQENTPNPQFDPELARQLYRDVDVSRIEMTGTAAAMREPLRGWRETMDAVVKRNLISTDARPIIVLSARAAEVHGSGLRYEAAAHRNALTHWSNAEDWPSWKIEVTTPGDYAVELLYGCAGGEGGSVVQVQIGEQTLAMKVEATGHPENFAPRVIGHVKLAAGSTVLSIKPQKKAAGAVMCLRQVVLVPAGAGPEH